MKLKLLLIFSLFLFSKKLISQDVRAFAITGQAAKNFNWTDIRMVNLKSGNIEKTIFENGVSKFSFVNPSVNKAVVQLNFEPADLQKLNLPNTNNQQVFSPTMLMSAAAAYDKKHDRLFFATMRTNQLIWLDLSQQGSAPAFFTTEDLLLQNPDVTNESLNITRMTIGADGNGYAITNDGSHLIKFITGRKVIISDMGSLKDATSNNGISIHNSCSSWGGDVVADAFGKLQLFTATKNLFEIDPATMVATYKGAILNLPPTFTLNGAAVIDDYNVMVSSANTFEGFYSVNIKDLAVKKIEATGPIFNASDLASGNLLRENEKQNSVGTAQLRGFEVLGNKFISVYPNPVRNSQFKITFDNNEPGKYKINLNDLQGRLVASRIVYVKLRGQIENFRLERKHAAGLYTIKVTDAADNIVYSDKLIVE